MARQRRARSKRPASTPFETPMLSGFCYGGPAEESAVRQWCSMLEGGPQDALRLRPDLFLWAHLASEALLQAAKLGNEQSREMTAHIDNLYRDGQEVTAAEYEKKLRHYRPIQVGMPAHDQLEIGIEPDPWPNDTKAPRYQLALTFEHGIRVKSDNGPTGTPPMLARTPASVGESKQIASEAVAWILRRLAPFQGAFDVWGKSASAA